MSGISLTWHRTNVFTLEPSQLPAQFRNVDLKKRTTLQCKLEVLMNQVPFSTDAASVDTAGMNSLVSVLFV